ncbi:MAG: NAD(P)/FAD-dependent oxidoreductase [Actinomycetota bacterium]|nr:NAD(P)/FAD-dependent oxidoreductase [Actinomycetota bacterium]
MTAGDRRAAPGPPAQRDAVIVGGGHNGLVAAILLARAGRSVLVLERGAELGGAAVSRRVFPGVDARVSCYSYLVSLFPAELRRKLGLQVELRTRSVSSYTPDGDDGLLICDSREITAASLQRLTGDRHARARWEAFSARLSRLARRVSGTLTRPLPTRGELRGLVDDDAIWSALIEEPLGRLLERWFESDLLRGVVLTDATIGTFAPAEDPLLRQNRCFLYHVIGDGTGLWKVPVGGMGALTGALIEAAARAGVEVRTGAEVVGVETDGTSAEVSCADGSRHRARHVLANVAPAVLTRLLGQPTTTEPGPEGSQLKLNLLLSRLPRLRDSAVTVEQAFAGTFHVNEGYQQMQQAYAQAAAGSIPGLPPCELYCHSLTDPTILSPELRAAGAHTLTAFALHMPARLFGAPGAKAAAVAATIDSINSVLGEPIEDCLWIAPDGEPCLDARTPLELEAELGMPGGHIFHRDLAWPFAESEDEVGSWGVETAQANVWLCGAGARRGGGVSGIPGHNAARALLTR